MIMKLVRILALFVVCASSSLTSYSQTANQVQILANAGPYLSTATYSSSSVVREGTNYYISRIARNKGNDPATSPTQWGPLGSGTGSAAAAITGLRYGNNTGADTLATSAQVQATIGSSVYDVSGAAAAAIATAEAYSATHSTTGNANTSTAFASTPTKCSAGLAPTGVDAGGNAVGCASIIAGTGEAVITGLRYGNGAGADTAGSSAQLQAVIGASVYDISGAASAAQVTAQTYANSVNTTGTSAGLSVNIAESKVTNLVNDLAAKQATLVYPVTGPGFGAVVGHLAVIGNVAGTQIVDGGPVPSGTGGSGLADCTDNVGVLITCSVPIQSTGFQTPATAFPSVSIQSAGTSPGAAAPALPANSYGDVGPLAGGTPYLRKWPATASVGIFHAAAPGVGVDGINEQLITASPVSPADMSAGGTTPDATKAYYGDGSWKVPAGGSAGIASIQVTIAAGAISATCSANSAGTATMPGLLATSGLQFTPTSDLTTVAGWSNGDVFLSRWPSAGVANYHVCTTNASGETIAASTWNVTAQ